MVKWSISESHQQKFQKYTAITQTTYEKLYMELERCHQIKKVNMKLIIKTVTFILFYSKTISIVKYNFSCARKSANGGTSA